jgi:hypothetical protein
MADYTIAPAGVSAASFFEPSTFVDPAKPPSILAMDVDPTTREWRSILEGVHPVDAGVLDALTISRGTGAVVEFVGNRFADIRKNTASAPKALEYEVKRAVKPYLDRGDISVDHLAILAGEDAGDTGGALLVYTNLRTRQRRQLRLIGGYSTGGA